MFNLILDVKKFLSLPLNDGTTFLSPGSDLDSGCGCIKGNIARSSNILSNCELDAKFPLIRNDIVMQCAIQLQNSLVCNRNKKCSNWDYNMFGKHFGYVDPKLQSILDYAEKILLYDKKPQHAKLFVIRALCRFGYIPQDAETVRSSAVIRNPEPELAKV